MKSLLVLGLVALTPVAIVVVWTVTRRRDRRTTPVTHAWRNEHAYDREGDRDA